MAYIESPGVRTHASGHGLNIAAVSRRTGVAPDTLRKWERRYGVLRPSRTPGGQRRYDEVDLARVEWLRDRLVEGFRIGAAAALLEDADAAAVATPDGFRDALVATARGPEPQRLVTLVEQAFTLHPVAVAVEEIVSPAFGALGKLSDPDSFAIASEHLLSETVRARLKRMLSDRRPGVRGKAVLACSPGERHELGLLALAVMLQADGWLIAYLGADSPVDSALGLAERIGAEVVCVSFTLQESLERFAAELERLPAGELPSLVAGGPAIAGTRELAFTMLESGLEDAVGRLRAA
jgi:MerR family transcriptional regulator, light-induced transcriptional regulator